MHEKPIARHIFSFVLLLRISRRMSSEEVHDDLFKIFARLSLWNRQYLCILLDKKTANWNPTKPSLLTTVNVCGCMIYLLIRSPFKIELHSTVGSPFGIELWLSLKSHLKYTVSQHSFYVQQDHRSTVLIKQRKMRQHPQNKQITKITFSIKMLIIVRPC